MPIGDEQLPVSIVFVVLLFGWGVISGVLPLAVQDVRLYALAVGCLLVAGLSQAAIGLPVSWLSILLLGAIYVLATVEVPLLGPTGSGKVQDRFVFTMMALGSLGLVQGVVQYLGVPYRDWLTVAVPGAFIQAGYNTGDPIVFGSEIYRVNAVIFLEPSFFSLFLGLAFVVAMCRRRPWYVLALLLVAMVPSVALNGPVVVAVALAGWALRREWRRVGRTVALVGSAAVVAAVLIPGAARLLQRGAEVGTPGTSGSVRVVEPYTAILPAWLNSGQSALLGHGPGSATSFLEESGIDYLLAPVLPKLLYEYGAVAGAVFLVFLGCAFARERRVLDWRPPLLLAYFVVNASLLQPAVAIAAIVFMRMLSPAPADATNKVPGDAEPTEPRPNGFEPDRSRPGCQR